MQYHMTVQVNSQQWENDQQTVLDDVRRRVQHDLAAQNPNSTVNVDSLQHTVRPHAAEATRNEASGQYLVDVVVEYTIGGQPNPFAA